jgi:hypothetical protein
MGFMRRLALAFALAFLAAACGSSSLLTAPASVTETFTGTVPVQGLDSHTFTVAAYGEIDVTLTAAGPPSTITMGLGLGTPTGGTCSVQYQAQAQAGTTAQLSGTIAAGSWCVVVFDLGNQGGPVDYSVTVAHS